MNHLPLFHNLKSVPCLIIGGGEVALRKADLLTRAGAKVTILSSEIEDQLQDLIRDKDGELIFNNFTSELDMTKYHLVIAGTDDEEVNKQVHKLCREQRVLVNVVDQPEYCDVIFPAIVDRSPILIAISSGGVAPVLARWVRTKLESSLPFNLDKLGSLAQKYRDKVKSKFSSITERRYFWEKVFNGAVANAAYEGDLEKAENELVSILEQDGNSKGEVYLVGAGPGDPELMTFKALRLLQQADVVVYDRLVAPEVVDMARRDAEKIYVGKKRDVHALPQDQINSLLAEKAKKGLRVCRLKGGDPYIFGRGGEEAEELVEEGVSFQVVPGITAAAGCSSYCGIPLTHRDHAQSVRFVTGHLKNPDHDLPWNEMVHSRQTLVFYMGLAGVERICKELVDNGMSPEMPAALVQKGTTKDQKLVVGNLSNLNEKLKNQELKSPTLIIVGTVVNLSSKLATVDIH